MARFSSCYKLSPNLSKTHKHQTSNIWLCHALYFLIKGPDLTVTVARLSLHLCLFQDPPSSAQVAAMCRLLCRSGWVTLCSAQMVAALGRCTWKAPEQVQLMESFRHQTQQTPEPCKSESSCVESSPEKHIICYTQSVLTANQHEGQYFSPMC